MRAAELMTGRVISVTPETTIAEAARLMVQHRISGLPVLDSSCRVVGIVSEGDLLRRAETGTERRRPRWLEFITAPGRLAQDYAEAHARKVGEVMTAKVISIAPGEEAEHIVRTMQRHRVKRLPVIDAGRLVGIVTRGDLVRAFVDKLAAPERNLVLPDAEIRERILAEIRKQPWVRSISIDVQVRRGEVELRGTVTEERARAALRILAENVPGVRKVRHRLVWLEGLPPS